MTASDLLKLTDDQLDAIPVESIQAILAEERARLDRLARRRRQLLEQAAEGSRPKTLREVSAILGLSPETVRKIEKIALLKARQKYPTIKHLLES